MIDRKKLLASALREAAIKAQEEQDLQRQIARVTADVHARLAQHKAETSNAPSDYKLTCVQCGAVHRISADGLEPWETDEETADTGGDSDVDDYDNRQARSNNRKPIRPLSGLTRAQIMASLNKISC